MRKCRKTPHWGCFLTVVVISRTRILVLKCPGYAAPYLLPASYRNMVSTGYTRAAGGDAAHGTPSSTMPYYWQDCNGDTSSSSTYTIIVLSWMLCPPALSIIITSKAFFVLPGARATHVALPGPHSGCSCVHITTEAATWAPAHSIGQNAPRPRLEVRACNHLKCLTVFARIQNHAGRGNQKSVPF